jgi:hypothetical protein
MFVSIVEMLLTLVPSRQIPAFTPAPLLMILMVTIRLKLKENVAPPISPVAAE